jgi:virginiamycin B lyase
LPSVQVSRRAKYLIVVLAAAMLASVPVVAIRIVDPRLSRDSNQQSAINNQQFGIQIDEWSLPNAKAAFVPHDPAFAPDGSAWYTAYGANTLGRLNPATGEIKEYPLPTADSGPHGLVADRQGNIWYTANKAGAVGRLDPKSSHVIEYKMPDPAARDPHTPVFDQRGILWFTVQNGNFIGKLDPSIGTVVLKPVSTPKAMPHGIVIDRIGRPIFAMAGINKIGVVEPKTMDIQEIVLPEGARPRRLAVTSDGGVWYGDSARGFLARLDLRTKQVKEFRSPGGAGSGPYSIAVTADIIWYTESSLDPNRLVRFDPKSESMQSWPLPSTGSVVRHAVAAPDGSVWLALSGIGKIARARTGMTGESR